MTQLLITDTMKSKYLRSDSVWRVVPFFLLIAFSGCSTKNQDSQHSTDTEPSKMVYNPLVSDTIFLGLVLGMSEEDCESMFYEFEQSGVLYPDKNGKLVYDMAVGKDSEVECNIETEYYNSKLISVTIHAFSDYRGNANGRQAMGYLIRKLYEEKYGEPTPNPPSNITGGSIYCAWISDSVVITLGRYQFDFYGCYVKYELYQEKKKSTDAEYKESLENI